MTEQAMQIAIAEWCGWKWWKHTKSETYIFGHPGRTKESLDDDQMQWEPVNGTPHPRHPLILTGVPDYLHDLNAIYEVEEKLPKTLHNKYAAVLHWLYSMGEVTQEQWWFACCHLTARQRCEALLKTIDKWKDS